jgi:hypothetical protein
MTGPRTATHASAGRRRRPSGARTRRRRPASRGRRAQGGARWWPAVLVTAVMLVGVGWSRAESTATAPPPPPTARCAIPGTPFVFTGEQVANARVIADVAHDRGLPERAVVIALATAQQESGLRNLNYGDRDSLGLFQQRPSMGWGTPVQVRTPTYAAGKFYDHLVQVPNWKTGELTLVADAVQRSAFPLAYGRWSAMARELAAALAGRSELACR